MGQSSPDAAIFEDIEDPSGSPAKGTGEAVPWFSLGSSCSMAAHSDHKVSRVNFGFVFVISQICPTFSPCPVFCIFIYEFLTAS